MHGQTFTELRHPNFSGVPVRRIGPILALEHYVISNLLVSPGLLAATPEVSNLSAFPAKRQMELALEP